MPNPTMNGMKAVSYTHLDVYKRQTLCCEAVLRIRECSFKSLGVSFCPVSYTHLLQQLFKGHLGKHTNRTDTYNRQIGYAVGYDFLILCLA